MNRLCDCDEEDKECRQNFDAETSWDDYLKDRGEWRRMFT